MIKFHLALNELWGFLFVVVRTAGILSAIPLIGGSMVPLRIRAGVVVAISIIMTPIAAIHLKPDWLDPVYLTVGLLAELLIGLVLGFATRLLMAAVELAGTVMGFQLGFSVAVQLDPITQVETPVLASFLTILASLLYFVVDGHHLLLMALGSSFTLIPPFGASLSGPLLTDMTQLMHQTLVLGLKLAIPVVVATFLMYVVLGVLGRVIPQMNVLMTSFPLTISAGLLVLGFGLPLWALVFQQSILGLEGAMVDLLQELGRG